MAILGFSDQLRKRQPALRYPLITLRGQLRESAPGESTDLLLPIRHDAPPILFFSLDGCLQI